MIIGLTGSCAAGKGETIRWTVARGCQIFLERANKNINNLNRVCKIIFFSVTRILLASNQMLVRKSKKLAPHQLELVKKFI